jgi:hypothetical protein
MVLDEVLKDIKPGLESKIDISNMSKNINEFEDYNSDDYKVLKKNMRGRITATEKVILQSRLECENNLLCEIAE